MIILFILFILFYILTKTNIYEKYNDVEKYYNNNTTINNIIDNNYFGKNTWHTPLKFNINNTTIDENNFMFDISNLKSKKNPIIIDYGCGLGTFLSFIETKYSTYSKQYKLYGVNISNNQINIAKSLVSKNINFIKSNGNNIDLKKNTCDIIFSQEAIVHHPEKKKLFTEFYRLLKNDGSLIIQDWFLFDIHKASYTNNDYKTYLEPLNTYLKYLHDIGFKCHVFTPIKTTIIKDNELNLGFTNYVIKCNKM